MRDRTLRPASLVVADHPGQRSAEKAAVQDFWQSASCGEVYAEGEEGRGALERHFNQRYLLEPYIADFARFETACGLDVLEIGLGMGADHARFAASSPRSLVGLDLTARATEWTKERLLIAGETPRLLVADAEALPFPDESFDLIYSWGVLHHTPDTPVAFEEVRRLLRSGGRARIMVYHSRSIVGYLLWMRYALLAGTPTRSMADVYAHHLESPGTKAYSVAEIKQLLNKFSAVDVRVQLSSGDLLLGHSGQRHQSRALHLAKRVWPRRTIERLFPNHGLCLLLDVVR